jgi:hypothetical protein
MTLSPKRLEELADGLVCLVPNEGKGGVTCHEYTRCDCEVLALLDMVKEQGALLERAEAFCGKWYSATKANQKWLSDLAALRGEQE